MSNDPDKTQPYVPKKGIVTLPPGDSKRVFCHYQGPNKRKRNYPPTINSMSRGSDGVLRYLNPFTICLLQSPKEKGRRGHIHFSTPPLDRIGYGLPRLEDYGEILKNHPERFRGYTTDFGLVLRSVEEPNQILAEDLADQINTIYGEVKFPLLISLKGTFLKYLPGSKYDGLSFKITPATQVVHAPILNQPGYFSLNDLEERTCLPTQTRPERKKSNDLELITLGSGLTKAYINIWRDIDCGHSDLAIVDRSNQLFVVRN